MIFAIVSRTVLKGLTWLLLLVVISLLGRVFSRQLNPPEALPDSLRYTRQKLKIDIKDASLQSLIFIPGVGDKTASKIIELRDADKLLNAEDLLQVKGIGWKKLERIRPYLIFPEESIAVKKIFSGRININTADVEELCLLSGIGFGKAANIIS
ncbi:MAG: helix-hairpin-helix domain-containing protein, partial [Candidatus Cloacimonetes bacterium]|nr:helix-hairpin-helix domain-containing protein [Candidatus Cloacimonadota bacterium]